MNAKHTPGPWQHHCDETKNWVIGGGHYNVVLDSARTETKARERQLADFKLISIAPELLSACKRMEKALTYKSYPELQGIADDISKAIAKSEGK